MSGLSLIKSKDKEYLGQGASLSGAVVELKGI